MLELRKPSARVREFRLKVGRRPGEAGVALLLTVILMLLFSAIGLSALQSAHGEAGAGSRSLRRLRTLFAANSVINIVQDQLDMSDTQYPDITALSDPLFLQNRAGLYTAVRTGTGDNAVPQEIHLVGRARREGDQLNINAGNTFSFGLYRTDAVAMDPVGGRVELQAQYRVNEGSDTYR